MGWIIGIVVLLVVIALIMKMVKKVVKKFKTSKVFRKKYFIFAVIVIAFYSGIYEFSWFLAIILFLPNILVGVTTIKSSFGQNVLKIQLDEWRNKEAPTFTITEIHKMLEVPAKVFYEKDSNTLKYHEENIPFGRANAFLHHFDKSIELEDVLFYSPKRSLDEIELREYGAMLTNAGLYLSNQYLLDKKTKEYGVDQFDIRFKGLFQVALAENGLTVLYSDFTGIRITEDECSIPLSIIYELCHHLIENKFTLALLQEKIIDDTITDGIDYQKAIKEEEARIQKDLAMGVKHDQMVTLGTLGAMDGINGQFDELKNLMNGRQGHGYAAEYGNNTIDKLQFKKVENAAANLENGRQVKHGADRVVNGVEIQTKYCQTPERTFSEMFQQGKLKYVDKNGHPMRVEVPRDQYAKVVKTLQRKIDNGEVKGVAKGTKAESIVAKGFWTFRDSLSLAKSGSIQSLLVDTANGTVTCIKVGGISALITFATNIWAGKTMKESLEASLLVAGKIVGRGTAIFFFSMQLSRPEFINYFSTSVGTNGFTGIGYGSINNPVYTLSEKAALQLRQSTLSKSTLGRKLNLKKVQGKMIIGSGVLMAFTFGPDITRAMVGRISPKQLFKNAATSTAAIAGATIGNTMMPFVGALVGGAVGGAIAKGFLDEFIEDDAKEMYQILKEEFLDGVMLLNLQKREFEEVLSLTMGNAELTHVLRDMYASKNPRSYASELLIQEAVIMVLGKRTPITEKTMDEALGSYVEAEYQVAEALA